VLTVTEFLRRGRRPDFKAAKNDRVRVAPDLIGIGAARFRQERSIAHVREGRNHRVVHTIV
jgi:hypothetical protein